MSAPPTVYILHGNDDFAISEALKSISEKIGDSASVAMNTTVIEGRSFAIDQLASVTQAMPFLAERRLVILNDPLGSLKSAKLRTQFQTTLNNIPVSTAFAIVIPRPLVDGRDQRKGKQHWLQKWASENQKKSFIREFSLPQGPQMARWIQTKAKELGGEFSYEAAGLLASYVLDDPRMAAQEIEKLLAYANYARVVELDDVERLTPYAAEGNIFEMVDALGNRRGEIALRILHRLLEEDEVLLIFGMIVRQFRMLLLTRDLLDAGYREAEITKQLKTHAFVARKLIRQAQNFTVQSLEAIYRKLLDVDESIKTGKIEGDIALDTLITALTT